MRTPRRQDAKKDAEKRSIAFSWRLPWRLGVLAFVLNSLLLIFRPASAPAQDLRVFETAHYRIHTDLDEDLSDDLAHRMDAMYDEYAHRLADFARTDDSSLLDVYLVHSQEKYLHLVGITMGGTGGSFNAARHLLAAFLDGQGRDALRRTLQHEAFHQFAAITIGKTIPIWLNEGLAQIFEEGIWTGDGFELGQVPPRRLRQLHQDIDDDSLIDFAELLKMPGPQWAAGFRNPTVCATQYNQAWALTHFLIYALDENGRAKYRSRLINMLKLLRDGADGDTAFRTAFSNNIAGFHDRFLEYAATLTPTPLAGAIENQGILADMLVDAARRHRVFSDIAQFRQTAIAEKWRINYRRGRVQWESDPDPGVYFRSPSGNDLTSEEQFLDPAADHPLPDLIFRYGALPALRTHFVQVDDKIEHETIVEGTDSRQ